MTVRIPYREFDKPEEVDDFMPEYLVDALTSLADGGGVFEYDVFFSIPWFSPGRPAKITGPPEDCYPAESAEWDLEIRETEGEFVSRIRRELRAKVENELRVCHWKIKTAVRFALFRDKMLCFFDGPEYWIRELYAALEAWTDTEEAEEYVNENVLRED